MCSFKVKSWMGGLQVAVHTVRWSCNRATEKARIFALILISSQYCGTINESSKNLEGFCLIKAPTKSEENTQNFRS